MEVILGGKEMRPLNNTYLFLLILCISFSSCFTLSTWPPEVGFGNGVIDLGGLLICQIKNFTRVWAVHEGGPDNVGANFYEPSELPDGFFMLGSYSQSNTNSVPGWVLAGKDVTNDPSGLILKSPIDYILVLNSTSLAMNHNGTAYIWRPIAPDGFQTVGSVITGSPEKPPLDKIRCVRSDFVTMKENSDWIWGSGDSNSMNLYSTMREGGSRMEFLVPTGTFLVQGNGSTPTSVFYLKNVAGNFSAMPNMAQIQGLIKEYSPVIYFHPDEHFFPSSVSWFFENGGLLYTKGQESKPVLIDPSGSNLPQGGSNDGLYWLDLPIDDASRDKVKRGNLDSAGSYIHIKPSLEATCTDIAIWIFYPYNGPAKARVNFINIGLGKIGEHVGDWEHVTLRISNFDCELKSVYFSQHSRGTWVDGSKIENQNGKRPVVYSSLHGHAAFPKAGMNLIGNGKIGVRNDAAKGKMFMDTGINYTIISADYLKPLIGEPSWLNYAREWGPKISYDLEDEMNKVTKILPGKLKRKFIGIFNSLPNEVLGEGPTGPKWKDSWDGDERV